MWWFETNITIYCHFTEVVVPESYLKVHQNITLLTWLRHSAIKKNTCKILNKMFITDIAFFIPILTPHYFCHVTKQAAHPTSTNTIHYSHHLSFFTSVSCAQFIRLSVKTFVKLSVMQTEKSYEHKSNHLQNKDVLVEGKMQKFIL